MRTFYLFPVERGVKRPGRRGVALVIAMLVLSFIMVFAADMILTSQVSIELSSNHRDRIKAEYMTRSAVNLAVLLLTVDFGIDLFQAQQNPKATSLSDGLGDMWSVLNGLPIGGETAEMIDGMRESLGLSAALDSGVLQQLQLFDGDFTLDVADEAGKINVNFCHQGRCTAVQKMMIAMMEGCPAEKPFVEQELQKDNVQNATQFAGVLQDWIDVNTKAEPTSGFASEDDPYSSQNPPYRAKNAPLDTLDELLLLKGWNQRLHAVFSPYLTIFPLQRDNNDQPKMNLNTVPRELLSCFFPESRGECAEKSTLAVVGRNKDKTNLVAEGSSVKETLQNVFCAPEADGESNRSEWFSTYSMVFRVTARGNVGDQEQVLETIVERRMPDDSKKEKTSYRFLFWKAI